MALRERPPESVPDQGPPPAATRTRKPGWRDPRLWVGLAIVAASVLLGARVLAGADDTVAVWSLVEDVGQGDRLTESDLTVTRVQFADGSALARYLTPDDTLPADVAVLRPLGAGELLPRTAVGAAAEVDTTEISVEVQPGLVPTGVTVGSVVDVHLVGGGEPPPQLAGGAPALDDVSVVDAPAASESFGTSGSRQLVLAVPADAVDGYFALLASLDAPVVYVSRVG